MRNTHRATNQITTETSAYFIGWLGQEREPIGKYFVYHKEYKIWEIVIVILCFPFNSKQSTTVSNHFYQCWLPSSFYGFFWGCCSAVAASASGWGRAWSTTVSWNSADLHRSFDSSFCLWWDSAYGQAGGQCMLAMEWLLSLSLFSHIYLSICLSFFFFFFYCGGAFWFKFLIFAAKARFIHCHKIGLLQNGHLPYK